MNAIFKYPGSKWSVAKWIIDFFPEHHSYLEPFAGSLAVLMNKPRSHIETVNDLDGNVVNLFHWIRDDPEKLAHEIYFALKCGCCPRLSCAMAASLPEWHKKKGCRMRNDSPLIKIFQYSALRQSP